MRPGPLLPRLIVITAALAVLIPVALWVEWVVVGAFVVVVVAAGTEAVALRRVMLVAERPAKIALALDETEATAVELRSNAARPLRLIVRQRWPELVAQRSLVAGALCRPGEVVRVDMSVRAIARRSAVVERVAVARTFFGIVERIARAGAESELDVLPNPGAVRRLHKQLTGFALRGIGARAAPRIGKGREFDRLRDYVLDDDYRDIAWRASARHGRL